MFSAPESNVFMKKRSDNVQGLAFQEVLLLCAVRTLLLCYGYSIPQVSPLQNFSLPGMGSIWTFSRVRCVLTRCAFV